jgi:hypothetical protein
MTYEIIIILGLCVVLGIVLSAFEKRVRELANLKKQKELIEDRARERAFKILEEAKDRSLNILKEARIFAEQNNEKLNKRLDRVSDKQLKSYEEVLQNISNTVETDALREIEDFRQALQLETLDTQKIVSEKIESQFDAVKKQIEQYREEKMKLVDERVVGIVEDVTRAVIGKNISMDEHAEIIIKALEDAKEKYVF